jgi:hypothetical protein
LTNSTFVLRLPPFKVQIQSLSSSDFVHFIPASQTMSLPHKNHNISNRNSYGSWSRPIAKTNKNIPQFTAHLLYIIPKLLSLVLQQWKMVPLNYKIFSLLQHYAHKTNGTNKTNEFKQTKITRIMELKITLKP